MNGLAVKAVSIDFHGEKVRSWREPDGKEYLLIRDPCRNLGIDPKDQQERLQTDEFFQRYTIKRHLTLDRKRHGKPSFTISEVVGLDTSVANLWLASIQTNTVREDVRPKLILYKEECARVLANHWALVNSFVGYGPGSWDKRFPNDFYPNVCRVMGWPLPSEGRPDQHTPACADFTREWIYEILPPNVQEMLEIEAPTDGHGYRRERLHQFLTEDQLSEAKGFLNRRIIEVMALLRISDSADEFRNLMTKHDYRVGTPVTIRTAEGQKREIRLKRGLDQMLLFGEQFDNPE